MSGTREQEAEGLEDEAKVVEGEAVEVEGSEEAEDKAEDKADEGKKAKPWFQARIDEVTREKWTARREADAARERAAMLEKQMEELLKGDKDESTTNDESKPLSPAEVDKLASQKAEAMLQVKEFNEQCNAVFDKGKAIYEDFEDVLTGYRDLGGLTTTFIEAALETGAAHQVLYELGKNQDEAYRILKLSPVKMAVEMTKLAEKLAKPKAAPVSKAPPPITTPRGKAKPAETDPDKMSTKEWMAWREKNIKAD